MSMSRLADYDRWDYVDESDEEAPAPAAPVDAPPPVRSSPEPEPASEDWMLEAYKRVARAGVLCTRPAECRPSAHRRRRLCCGGTRRYLAQR